jgi:hypothetical protein
VPEIAIALYGDPPSFDRRTGRLTALIEVEGGTDRYLVDQERNRCRIDSFPGRDLDRWTTPGGVLLAARRGWWGLTLRLDLIPHPTVLQWRSTLVIHRAFQRPHLPRDLASCPTCRRLVVIERERERPGDGFRLVTPSWRLAASARAVMISVGLMPFVVESAKGRGRKAGRVHGLDCYDLPLFRPFAEPKPRPGRVYRKARRASP